MTSPVRFAVTPLTEDAGLIEWVNGVEPLRHIVRRTQPGGGSADRQMGSKFRAMYERWPKVRPLRSRDGLLPLKDPALLDDEDTCCHWQRGCIVPQAISSTSCLHPAAKQSGQRHLSSADQTCLRQLPVRSMQNRAAMQPCHTEQGR